MNALYNDIITTYYENVLQFVTGQRALSEFDDFTAHLKDMGIERCIEIEQEALDRYYMRLDTVTTS